jgi:Zn-dependent protease
MTFADTDRPRLAPGVESAVFPRQTVIGDARGDAYLRLTELEWDLAQRLDGAVTVGALRARFGAVADDLLADLANAGLLAPGPTGPRRRLAVTWQGLEARGGDAAVRFLHDRLLRWLFSPVGCALVIAVIVAGGVLFVRAAPWHGQQFVVDRVAPTTAVLVILGFGIATDLCHELGHAVVTVHYGRRMSGFGVGFHWGAPSFYVDAGQALFLPRRQRALQSAAGVIVDLTLAGLAQIAVTITASPLMASALHLITALAYLDVLVNLLPILDLDGYWILADLLDRPTLRQEAGAAALGVVRRDGTRPPKLLVGYAVGSWACGLLMIASSIAVWWSLFGDVNRALWHGDVAHQALAAWMLLPQLGAVLHVGALAAVAAIRALLPDEAPRSQAG